MLVGPPGVGRRSLISKIVNSNPSLFGTTKAGKLLNTITEFTLRAGHPLIKKSFTVSHNDPAAPQMLDLNVEQLAA